MKRVLLDLVIILVILSSVASFPVAAEESNESVLTAVYKGKEDDRHCFDLILTGSPICYIQFAVIGADGESVVVKNVRGFDFMAGEKNIFYANTDVNINGKPFARLYISATNESDIIPDPKFTDIEAYNYDEQIVHISISIDKSVNHHQVDEESTSSTNSTVQLTPGTVTNTPNNSGSEPLDITIESPSTDTIVTEASFKSSDITEKTIPLHQVLFICSGVMLTLSIICGIILVVISRKEKS